MRGLGISELFAFMLRCAARQSRQTESEKATTGKLTYVLQSLLDESLDVRLFLLVALHGLGVTGLAGTVKGLCLAQTGDSESSL